MAGYHGYSKSNNAVAAEEEGKVVRSKITRAWLAEGGIDESPAFIKWLAAKELIIADEWHHTSKFYNEVDYFSVEGIKEELERLALHGRLEQIRQIYAAKETRKFEGHFIADLATYMATGTTVMSEFYTAKLAAFVEEFNLA